MSCLLLATDTVSGHVSFLHNLEYQLVGVMIVMTSLGGLAVIVSLVAAGLSPFQRAPKKVALPGAPEALPAITSPSAIPPEILAVIAASVHVSLKTPHRILGVRHATNPLLQAWSIEGRRQIFQSHSFR